MAGPDIWDQAAQANNQTSNQPGVGDVWDQAEQQMQPQESTAQKVERVANTPTADIAVSQGAHPLLHSFISSLLGPAASIHDQLQGNQSKLDNVVNYEINHGNPYRAGIARFFAGVNQDVSNLAGGMSSPLGLVSQAAAPSKLASTAATAYFGMRSGQQLKKGIQELIADKILNPLHMNPEHLADALFGGSGLAFAGASGARVTNETIGGTVRQYLQKQLGITGKLSDQVAERVRQAKVAQNAAAAREQEIRQRMGTQIEDTKFLKQQAEQDQLANAKQVRRQTAQTVADVSQAVEQEHARVSKPFEEMAAQAQDPVTDGVSLRSMIYETANEHGVNEEELPKKLFAALGSKGVDALDRPGEEGSGSLPGEHDVTFGDLNRVRNDAYDVAATAKDPAVRIAANEVYQRVMQMQQDYANDNGFGPKFRATKAGWLQFKRELGSDLMNKFLAADDVQQQDLSRKLSMITNGKDIEALRTLFKVAGVDVKPLDDLLNEKTMIGQRAKELGKRAVTQQKEMNAQLAEAGKYAQNNMKTISGTRQVVPGADNLDLAAQGLTENELKAAKIKAVLRDAQSKGITNPGHLVMTLYGLIRLSMGSPFGFFPLGYGLTRMKLPELLQKPEFQRWIINDAGVTDPAMKARLRNALVTMAGQVAASQGRTKGQAQSTQ